MGPNSRTPGIPRLRLSRRGVILLFVMPDRSELDELDEEWARKTIEGVKKAREDGRWLRGWLDGIEGEEAEHG